VSMAEESAALSMSYLRSASLWSFRIQVVMMLLLCGQAYLLGPWHYSFPGDPASAVLEEEAELLLTDTVLPLLLVYTAIVVIFIGAVLTRRDVYRERFGYMQRFLYWCASGTLYMATAMLYYEERPTTSLGDELVMNIISLYWILSMVEGPFIPMTWHRPTSADATTTSTTRGIGGGGGTARAGAESNSGSSMGSKRLSRKALFILLKPYFWPAATSESALINRFRAIMTWVCVICSKICNLTAPILLGWASTALAHQQYVLCIQYSIGYSAIGFLGAAFKEGQSLVYLKVRERTNEREWHSLSRRRIVFMGVRVCVANG
jgi:hypothetical protein